MRTRPDRGPPAKCRARVLHPFFRSAFFLVVGPVRGSKGSVLPLPLLGFPSRPIRRRFFHQHQLFLLAIDCDWQLARVQLAPEVGDVVGGQFIHEAQGGRGEVGAVFLESDPAPVESFCRPAGGVGAGEDVQHDVAGVGEELDEERWQLFRSVLDVGSRLPWRNGTGRRNHSRCRERLVGRSRLLRGFGQALLGGAAVVYRAQAFTRAVLMAFSSAGGGEGARAETRKKSEVRRPN